MPSPSTEDTPMTCAVCGHTNPSGSRFCAQCGQRLADDAHAVPDSGSDVTTGMLPNLSTELGMDHGENPNVEGVRSGLAYGTALLLTVRGPNSGARFLLDKSSVNVGRHPNSDIFLDDITVSRRHAHFLLEDDRLSVSDAGSLNGTYVNGKRAKTAVLNHGDHVQIGKFRLQVITPKGDR